MLANDPFSRAIVPASISRAISSKPQLRCLDDPGRRGEIHSLTILENHRLVLVWHARMHDRTVAVALHMLIQALVWVCPRDFADLSAVKAPIVEALEQVFKPQCILMGQQVDEGIPQVDSILKVHGQVHEVVAPLEFMLVQQRQQRAGCISVGNVPQHHRGGLSLRLRRRYKRCLGGAFSATLSCRACTRNCPTTTTASCLLTTACASEASVARAST
mmetsp:Transcript_58587/g.168202  ORF Transcript_58587/g.168202 Transcript_58587/m.168202 type:complete len:217 (-) Transcript_58587:700-1350(-)